MKDDGYITQNTLKEEESIIKIIIWKKKLWHTFHLSPFDFSVDFSVDFSYSLVIEISTLNSAIDSQGTLNLLLNF